MLEIVRTLLESSPLLALFLAIAVGYWIGQISIAGVSFGAGAVLFSGLIIGAIAPKAAPPAMVGTLGLVMFVYGAGSQYGPQFFASLRGPGIKYIALATVAVLASLGVAWLVAKPLGISIATAAGLFAGSGTGTPTLQAALAAAGNQDPAIGYSVSYPFGVVGPIVLMTIMTALLKPIFEQPSQNVRVAELTLESKSRNKTVGELSAALPSDVKIIAVRQNHMNAPPAPETLLQEGDGLLLVGSPRSIEEAKESMEHEDPGAWSRDRANYDVIRVYVSKAAFVGKPLREVPLPAFPVMVSHARRGDLEMIATPDLTIEFGDLLVAAVPTGKKAEVQRHSATASRATPNYRLCRLASESPRPDPRHDPDPPAGRWHLQPWRRRWSPRHGAGAGLAWPNGTHRMENAGRGQHGLAKSGPVRVHRISRPRRGEPFCADRGLQRSPDFPRRGCRPAHPGPDRPGRRLLAAHPV